MRIPGIIATFSILVVLATGCGGSDDTAASTTTTSPSSTETTVTTQASTTTTTEATTTSTTTEPTTTTSEPVTLEQPAIWPAPDVVFNSPEESAADFLSQVLDVPPALGDFQQGDSRSGEIEVLLMPEGGGGAGTVRSLLLMRQLGPDDGWFVLAAINEANTITAPQSMAEVTAGPVEVAGAGRGFEATLIVEAFVAGESELYEQQITQGGSFETPEPYSVTLDFSGLDSGTTMMLLVRGGVGLETDPGEFSAIPVVIG